LSNIFLLFPRGHIGADVVLEAIPVVMSFGVVIHIYVCFPLPRRRHFVAVTRYAIIAVFVWSFEALAIWQIICDHSSKEVLGNFHIKRLYGFGESVNKKICDSSIIHFIDKLDFSVKAVFCDNVPLFLCGGAFAQPIFESVIEFVHCDFGDCAHVMRPS